MVSGNEGFPLFAVERAFRPGYSGLVATCPFCGFQWGRMGFSDEPPSRRLFLAAIPCSAHGTHSSPGSSFLLILPLFGIDLNLLSRPFLEYETGIKIFRLLNPNPLKTNQ